MRRLCGVHSRRLCTCIRSLLTLIALVAGPSGVWAQTTPAAVAGRVLDAGSGSPIAFASIVLEDAASGMQVAGTLTGEDGRFVVRGLGPGSYRVTLSFLGFEPGTTDLVVSPLNQTYDLGDVRLPRVPGYTEAITVAGQANRAEGVDTQVFRLNEGPTQSTGTLLDALKNLPGVTIDPEGRVLLRGSDRVSVVIDGRQSSLTGFGSQRGLDSVSAANVEAIEIINNPSARFDAAGMAGVINVIYRQDRQLGWSGDAGLSLAMGQFTKRRPDLPTDLGSFAQNEKATPSLSVNYATPRLRAFVQSEVLVQDDLPNNEFTTRVYDDGRVIESQVPENREQYHYTVRFGADWKIDRAYTMTLSGVHDFERHVDVAQVPFILASTGQRQRFWFWREQEDTGFTNGTVDLRRQFDAPGHELRVNLQYTRGKEDEAYFLNEESRVRVGTDATHLIATEHTLPLSLDYTRPMRTGRLELGTKVQRRWIPVSYQITQGLQSVIYPGLGDYSDWDEDILAAYANLVRVTPAYTLEAGVRLEQTNIGYTIPPDNTYYAGSDSYDYFEVFPNARLSYRLGQRRRLLAAYNRRIDRPGEPELRIFPKYDDPELLKVGNPYLRPQFTNAAELGVSQSWSQGSVNATIYHRDIKNAFTRVFAIDTSNQTYDIVNRLYENAGNSQQTGLQLLVEQQVASAWRLSGNVNLFRNHVDGFATTLFFPTPRPFAFAASTTTSWDVTLNNRLKLPRAVEAQVNVIYYARRNVPQGFERARSSVDVTVTRRLMKERAELQASFSDIFNNFGVQREVVGQGFTALYQNYLESQVGTIALKVRF